MDRPAVVVAAAALAIHVGPASAFASGRARRLFRIVDRLADPSAIALTFDDGPHPSGTPAVLRALGVTGTPGTFFLTGEQVIRFPAVARAIVDAGHTVGVHGYRHRLLSSVGPAATKADLQRARDVIVDACGVVPTLYRPPYGIANAAALVAARRLALVPTLWTRWGADWRRRATVEGVVSSATAELRGGEIVLLHDADHYAAAGSWRTTAAAVPLIVAAAVRQGLAFRPLDVSTVRNGSGEAM